VYKQQYVNSLKADPQAAGKFLVQKGLRRALEAYWRIYQSDPKAASLAWSQRGCLGPACEEDGVKLPAELDAREIAQEILSAVGAGGQRRTDHSVPGHGYGH